MSEDNKGRISKKLIVSIVLGEGLPVEFAKHDVLPFNTRRIAQS